MIKKEKIICLLSAIVLIFGLTACNNESKEGSLSAEESRVVEFVESADEKIDVYPTVRESRVSKNKLNIASVSIIKDNTTDSYASDLLNSVLDEAGIIISDGADIKIHLGSSYVAEPPEGEAYLIDSSDENNIYLCSKSGRGQYYAVQTFSQLIKDKKLNALIINDSPKTAARGTIEGFYGVPWSHEDRLSLINFSGKYKLNTYIYAPKDDAKHREQWREMYTDDELTRMNELIDACKKNHVDFVYAISPGLDINYGSQYQTDFDTLIKKCNDMYNFGVRSFSLLLDDLPSRTKDTALNHAKLVNDFNKTFYSQHNDLTELVVVFVEYYNKAISNDYSQTIAEMLDENIFVMWTGTDVTQKTLSTEDMKAPNELYGRKMYLWWNYPVNDYASNHLLLDALKGLDKELPEVLSGFVSNPMNQLEASKIPLFTISDYLWNPQAYNYGTSFKSAIERLHPNTAESVKLFCENVNACVINGGVDSIKFTALINLLNKSITEKGDVKKSVADLSNAVTDLKNAIIDIRNNDINKNFIKEITPWLDKGLLVTEGVEALCSALNAENESVFWDCFLQYLKNAESASTNNARVSGYVLEEKIFNAPKLYVSNIRQIAPYIDSSSVANTSAVLTASKVHYLDYTPSLATDGNDRTFYWSSGKASKGFWVKLDLGQTTDVFNICIKSANSASPEDYIDDGILQYSVDGSIWTNIGRYSEKEIYLDGLNIQCRYIRYLSQSTRDKWLVLREFSCNTTESSPLINCTLYGEIGHSPCKMLDGDFSTSFCTANAANGDSARIKLKGTAEKKATFYQSEICNADVYADDILLGKLSELCVSFDIPENTDELIINWLDSGKIEINEIVIK